MGGPPLGRSVMRALRWIVAGSAETLTALALVIGWLLLTDAIALVGRPAIVWRVSLGLLAISLAGWKLLLKMVVEGLYLLNLHGSGPR